MPELLSGPLLLREQCTCVGHRRKEMVPLPGQALYAVARERRGVPTGAHVRLFLLVLPFLNVLLLV